MAKKNLLQDRTIKTAKPEDTEWLNDGDGLRLRVRPSGKEWYYVYRRPGQNETKLRIGSYPEQSLSEARAEADKLRKEWKAGIDPKATREEAERQKAIEAKKAEMPRTVQELFDYWNTRYLAIKRKDGGQAIAAAFRKDVLPAIGPLRLDEVRKGHVAAILDEILARGSNRMANLMLSYMRQIFGFAISRDWMDIDPTARLRKADFGGKEDPRERVLSQDEIQALAKKLPDANMSKHSQAAIWIMLATACRVGEITRARWVDVDFHNGLWTIPEENSKNGKAHLVHLSPFACQQFEILRSLSYSSEWVLPALRKDDGPLCIKTLQKQIRDRQRNQSMKGRARNSQALVLDGGDWTAHDLRRTAATLMGELNVRPDVIDRCQNHVENNRVTKTYQRQELLGERKAAFLLLGEKLFELAAAPNLA